MSFRTLFFTLLLLPLCSAYGYPPSPVYPVAHSGVEFEKEAETFVIAKAYHLSGLRNKDQFVNDPRDWEPVLEKLIREPSAQGITVSGVAFGYTVYRGTSNRPEIVAATGEWFNRHIQEGLKRHEKYAQEGNPEHPAVYGPMPRVVREILDVGSPAHLTRVLDYLNSPADEKIRLIDRHTPVNVAEALRNYGDATHLAAATAFVKRLRENGKSDVADDIDRSIERIKKDAAKKQAASPGGSTKSAGTPGTAAQSKNTSDSKPLLPWLAAVGALAAALFAYFRMKRTKD